MPDSPKIVEEKVVMDITSKIDEKKQIFIQELSNNLEEISKDYGPFLMEKLLQRLEKVVINFNDEFTLLVKSSFEKWKIKDVKLREMMADGIKVEVEKQNKEKNESSKSPNFIKDVKFGPTRIE